MATPKERKFQWQGFRFLACSKRGCERAPLHFWPHFVETSTQRSTLLVKMLLIVLDPFARGTPRNLPTIFEFLQESRSSHSKVFLCVWRQPAWPMLRPSLCLPMWVSFFAMPYRSLLLRLYWTDFQPSKRIGIVQQERLDFTSTKYVPIDIIPRTQDLLWGAFHKQQS